MEGKAREGVGRSQLPINVTHGRADGGASPSDTDSRDLQDFTLTKTHHNIDKNKSFSHATT